MKSVFIGESGGEEERRRNEDTDLEGKHIIFYQITVDYTF
jgi:hypothetical protein